MSGKSAYLFGISVGILLLCAHSQPMDSDNDDAVATGTSGTLNMDNLDEATRARMRERMRNWTNAHNMTNWTMPQINITMPNWDSIDSQDQEVIAAEKLELLEPSTWAPSPWIERCPVHKPATITVLDDGGLQMAVAYETRKMFTMVEGTVPRDLSHYDGIEVQFTTESIMKFKIRLSHGDGPRGLRFIAVINVNTDGHHILWLKWTDFHAEKISRRGVDPCVASDSCGILNTQNMTSFAVLFDIEKRSDWSAKFTFHHVTADFIGSPTPPPPASSQVDGQASNTAVATDAPSAVLQASDQAKATKFEYEDDGNVVGAARECHSPLFSCYAMASLWLAAHVL